MAIYRGTGGSSQTSGQATIDEVTTQAQNAASSASSASASASSASTSATNAATSAATASTQATNAATSASSASSSATSAASSASSASTSATAASTAQTAAETAQTAAETAETNASTSATSAASSATSAASSASAASTSETNAATSETNASTSATNAATSATSAASSATTATTKASEASSSATAAAASAASAATALDNFDDRYLGAKASAPSTDNDGDPLVTGAIYFDTTDDVLNVYDGTAWVAAATAEADVQSFTDYVYTATASQTAFSGADDNANTLAVSDFMIVTRNGIRLTKGVGYTVASNTVTLTTAAALNDIITITVFEPIATAIAQVVQDTTPQLGGTLDANGNTIDMGTNIITDTKVGQWDTAYGWGDHSTAGYLTSFTETNNLSTAVTWANVPDANITQSSVTQHQAALSITESQISDFGTYATSAALTSAVANSSNWDTAYGWGDHSTQNYATTTGDTMTGALNFGDNVKAQFGASNDLQIYHDGSNSYITDAGTGTIHLRSDTEFRVQNAGGTANYLYALNGGLVRLYYNNSGKLDTTSTGVSVTGTLDVTTVDLGNWTVTESAGVLYFATGGVNKMKLDASGNLTVTGNVTAYGSV
jgi:chemotaxis protein histidine kinase CheA